MSYVLTPNNHTPRKQSDGLLIRIVAVLHLPKRLLPDNHPHQGQYLRDAAPHRGRQHILQVVALRHHGHHHHLGHRQHDRHRRVLHPAVGLLGPSDGHVQRLRQHLRRLLHLRLQYPYRLCAGYPSRFHALGDPAPAVRQGFCRHHPGIRRFVCLNQPILSLPYLTLPYAAYFYSLPPNALRFAH